MSRITINQLPETITIDGNSEIPVWNNNSTKKIKYENLVSSTSTQTISFDENTKNLSISNGNTLSLSALTDTTAIDTTVRLLSTDWDSTYNTVKSYSATNWNYQGTDLKALSSNWDSTYSTVQSNSATKWDSSIVTTFSQLTSLKQSNQLVTGQTYVINDFMLMWWNQSINNTVALSSNVVEPLIVTALSSNKIAHEAKSAIHPEDIVYYDIDATSSNTWGTLNTTTPIPDFKGWIYRRNDTKKNIDIGWDWRYITNNCCRPDMSSVNLYNSGTTYNLHNVVKDGSGKLYYSVVNSNTNKLLSNTSFWLPVSPYTESLTYFSTNETYGFIAYKTNEEELINLPALVSTIIQQPTFTSSLTSQGTLQLTNCNNIKIEGGYNNVFLGSNINSNTIGNNFTSNTIGNNFYTNTVGNNFNNNTIGNNIFSNTIGNNFYTNTVGNNFNNNTIGNNFYYNTIGNNFYSNTIGNNFYSNTIGNNFTYNTVGNNFYSNTIGNSFYYNTIGNSFYYNTIGNSFDTITIGNEFFSNTIGNSFYSNTIGNYFYYNTIGNDFYSNTIGNNFYSNTIGNDFRRNIVENGCIIGIVTGSTHVYNTYNTRIFSNSNNTVRLSYFNTTDQLVVTDPTA